jgi:hypothetical protein
METAIYIILLISLYILYLTIKYKYTVCEYDIKDEPVDVEPVKVSQIFSQMFQDETPRPGKISLNIGSEYITL